MSEKTFAVCKHVEMGIHRAVTVVTHVAIPGTTRADELNTETSLCVLCSGHLAHFLTMLEKSSASMSELLDHSDAVRRKLEEG